ncbi:MAG: hypothetical protein RLZZ546_391 [Bacteroidota bacterium]|jgi:HEAT repeat protein
MINSKSHLPDVYIPVLIDRMLDASDHNMVTGYDSSKTISWAALREAETLTDTNYIDYIIEKINIEKNRKRRHFMYFIVYRICENTPNQKGLEFLIDRIDKETDKYVVSGILDGLIELHKPAETNLDKIFAATKHKTWQIWFSAISALQNTKNPKVEELMMEIIDNEPLEKSYKISNAVAVLYNCGTTKCIPSLERQLQNKSRNIKSEVKETIAVLKKKFNLQ